jgi:hypothetical protein
MIEIAAKKMGKVIGNKISLTSFFMFWASLRESWFIDPVWS